MKIIKNKDLIAIIGNSLAICISDDFEEAIISPNSKTIEKDMYNKIEEIELFELLLNENIELFRNTIINEIKSNLKKLHYCKLKEKKEFLNEINNFLDLKIEINWRDQK